VAVNGLASTPYNVAVGGTDFGDVYAKTAGTYWNSNNTATYQSAKSYIPEIPWNDSCASQLYAAYEGFSTTYGPSSYCNSLPSGSYNLSGDGGGGGPSGCATGGPSTYNVVSGTCAGYPKPSWQSGIVGNPNDGVRDLPDVSLFAADGQFGHAYIFCYSKSSSSAGALCTFGGANGNPVTWSWTGGTSFASPIMAGIQALVNQHAGGAQGNPNVVYYARAKTEYGTSGSSSCNSSNGNTVGSACIFYDVTQGDNAAPCTGSHNCYDPSGTYGVLSTSDSAFAPAYRATTGWDFATGIGTVNAYNLVMGWSGEETLSVTTFGASGSVTSSPAGINCVAPTCSGSFPIGTKVRLTAIPNTGMIFTGWSGGGCSGTGTCTVIMNAGQNVVAFFGFGEQPL
jgi:Divergent InlB B-repeat domain